MKFAAKEAHRCTTRRVCRRGIVSRNALFFGLNLALFFGGFTWTSHAFAAEPAELAPDLAYLRVTNYATDSAHIATALGADRALVLDLRYPPAEGAELFPLESLLNQRPTEAPRELIILISPQTPAPFAEALRTLPAKTITLGVAGSQPQPGVVVAQAPETDRRAYEALSEEIPLASLISGKLDKERYDEASLVRDFRNGTSTPPPTSPNSTPDQRGDEKVPVLTDRVLQRALHLHRALYALRPRAR